MANIVFCADGTWNTANDKDGITNVEKIFRTLEQSDGQTAKYDDGVGADGLEIQRLLGGAIGDGLFQKIKDGYDYVAQEYNDGDRIYLFGFSRGAYTARSLAGMIAVCGLPARYSPDATVDAFAAYRNRDRAAQLVEFSRKYGHRNAEIAMVGVWDTVGALGIPGDLFNGLDQDIYGFLDTKLHPDVKTAYHALAIDERRRQFPPTLWDASATPGQVMKQVWFAGVHSDIGGGYLESELSDITLSWMMRMAKANGVRFNADDFAHCTSLNAQNALGEAHESWNLAWGWPERRKITSRADAAMASSAQIRWELLPTYRPPNCIRIFESGGLPLEEVFPLPG